MTKKLEKAMNIYSKTSIILGIISIVNGVIIGTLSIIFGGYLLYMKKKNI